MIWPAGSRPDSPPALRKRAREQIFRNAPPVDLLDEILFGMRSTARRMRTTTEAANDNYLAVDSHFTMVKVSPKTGPIVGTSDELACKNPDCLASGEYETDWRHGDRTCRRCGAVQNFRSVESHEEEKRNFSDDDKDHRRTSQVKAPTLEGSLARIRLIAERCGVK